MIRVMLVDDHRLVRDGLTQLLAGAPDIEVVGAAADGAEVVDLASSCTPDVVLMDLSMPGVDGVAATRLLLAEQPTVRVIALTSFSGRIYQRYIRRGFREARHFISVSKKTRDDLHEFGEVEAGDVLTALDREHRPTVVQGCLDGWQRLAKVGDRG